MNSNKKKASSALYWAKPVSFSIETPIARPSKLKEKQIKID